MRRLRGGEKGGECDLVHPCHGLVMGVPTDGMKIEKDSFFWDRKNLGRSALRNSLQMLQYQVTSYSTGYYTCTVVLPYL